MIDYKNIKWMFNHKIEKVKDVINNEKAINEKIGGKIVFTNIGFKNLISSYVAALMNTLPWDFDRVTKLIENADKESTKELMIKKEFVLYALEDLKIEKDLGFFCLKNNSYDIEDIYSNIEILTYSEEEVLDYINFIRVPDIGYHCLRHFSLELDLDPFFFNNKKAFIDEYKKMNQQDPILFIAQRLEKIFPKNNNESVSKKEINFIVQYLLYLLVGYKIRRSAISIGFDVQNNIGLLNNGFYRMKKVTKQIINFDRGNKQEIKRGIKI